MKFFCENYGLKNLIKKPSSYKNPSNLTCIELILTNVSRSLQSMYLEVSKVHLLQKQGCMISI